MISMIALLRFLAITVLAVTMCIPLSAQKKVTASGTILGADGKPLPKSHAHLTKLPWADSQEHTYIIEAGKDGKWMMRVYPGLYRVEFTGVNHRRTEAIYAMIEEDGDNNFSTRLAVNPYFSKSEIDTVFIVYQHPKTFVTTYDAMTPLGAGRYRAMLPCHSDARAVCYHISGIMPDRNINGTQSLLYIYDGDGDYKSCVDCPENASEMEIILDLALLPDHSKAEAARELVQGAQMNHPQARGAASLVTQVELSENTRKRHFEDYDASIDTVASGADGKPWRLPREFSPRPWNKMYISMDGVHHYIDTIAVMELNARIFAEYAAAVETQRQAFENAVRSGSADEKVFTAAALAEALSCLDRDSLRPFSTLLSHVFDVVPPESPVWTLTRGYTRVASLPDVDRQPYLQGIIWRNASTSVRLGAYREYFNILRKSGTEQDSLRIRALLDSAMSVCVDGDCGSRAVVEAALGYRDYKKWSMERLKTGTERIRRYYKSIPSDELAGKAMPSFILRSTDSTASVLSSEDLRGKPYIFVAVKRKAVGINEGVEAALEAERMYSGHGLRSIICFDAPRTPTFTRIGKYLGYTSYLKDEGWDAIAKLNERFADFAYFSMLIDEKGIVRASSLRMTDEFLFFTLREYFGE